MRRLNPAVPLRQLPPNPVGFIYARASVDRQQTGQSVDGQIRDCRDHADDLGVRIDRVFRDDDRSASEFAQRRREDYEVMVPLVAAGAVNVLIATEAARLSRLMDEWVVLRRALRDTATLLLLGGRLYDMRDERDASQVTQEILQAEAEAGRTRARITRSTRQRAADGEVHGEAPYGYRRRYHETTRELVAQEEDPETAPIVREIVSRIAAGQSEGRIANDLTDRGIPTPGSSATWYSQTVLLIAQSPAYVGLRSYKGELMPGSWEPIVKAEERDAVLAVLALRAAKRAEDGGQRDMSTRAVHLMSGIARCSECASRMYRSVVKQLAVYRCRKHGCMKVAVHQDTLDVYVTGVVLAWLEKPGRREEVLAGSGQQRAAEAMGEINRLSAELEEAYADAESGDLTARGLGAVEKRILPALEAARAVAARAVLPRAASRVMREDVREVWPDLSQDEKRDSIREVARVVVTPIGAGVRYPRRVIARRVRIEWVLLDQGS